MGLVNGLPCSLVSVGFVQREGMEGNQMVSEEQGQGISSLIFPCPSADAHSSYKAVLSYKCSLQYLVTIPSPSCYSLLSLIFGYFTVPC